MLPPLPRKVGSGGAAPPARESFLGDGLGSLAGVPLDATALLALVDAHHPSPLDAARFIALGEALEPLLAHQPRFDLDAGSLALDPGRERKATGSYYTPAPLVEHLLVMTLDPLIDRALASDDPRRALLALRIHDPACGAGHLLLGAAARIARRLPPRPAPSPASWRGGEDVHEVVTTCLYGDDLHPVAAEVCRLRLARLSPEPLRAYDALAGRVRCADSVGGDEGWPEGAAGGFDVVVGNPPFVNAIRGSLPPAERARLRTRFPEFGGTADLAYLMLGAALRRVRPGGRAGMVMPRGLLNARSAERFRAAPPGGFRPVRLWVPPRADLFAGAAVFVCLVALAQDEGSGCEVCLDDDPSSPRGWHRGVLASSNWWLEAQTLAGRTSAHAAGATGARTPTDGGASARRLTTAPRGAAALRVGDRFEVSASMTAGDAYDAVPFVVDEREGTGPRLVTTGLIDPGSCLWGERVCRYLRRDLRHPRLALGATATASLRRRVEASRRPKILVAGLSRVVECYLDREGACIGAVSTYSIYHPGDDVGALAALCEHLLSGAVSERFRAELGAGALGGGNTTMRKDFLRQLPMP